MDCAWAASLLLHTGIFVTLAVLLRFAPTPPVGESERTVGVALVRQPDGVREYLTSQEARTEQQSSDAGALTQALPEEAELEIDLSDLLPSSDNLAGAATGVGAILV